MMLKRIDLHKTPMTLEQVLEQLAAGDEIMLLRDDAPIAHITPPVSETAGRVVELHEGEGWIADDFTDELPDSVWVGDEDYRHRQDPDVRDIYLRAYEEARTYWRGVGDTEKANLTDEQMDRLFWSFDEEGIPRLKSERPPDKRIGKLEAVLMQIQADGGIRNGHSIDPEKIDDILNEEFAEYLIQRMNRGADD